MEGKGRVLVVDDEPQFADMVELMLCREGFDVIKAHDGLSGFRAAFEGKPDVVLLDIMMPRMDGWELCRRLREVSDVPVIVVSARGREADIVRGLELGADDYMVKPFEATELIARVYALLRRTGFRQAAASRPMTFGNVTVDLQRRRVTRDGEDVTLTPTEFKLLATLVRGAGRVLPSRYLLTEVWGADYGDQLHYVRLYVRYLRQKLEEDPDHPTLISTEWGIGYRFQAYQEPATEE